VVELVTLLRLRRRPQHVTDASITLACQGTPGLLPRLTGV